jgi:hypothetical protein
LQFEEAIKRMNTNYFIKFKVSFINN